MSQPSDPQSIVNALVGVWEGTGIGEYPTINPFNYSESLKVTARVNDQAVHYEQRTMRTTETGPVASHWETGLIEFLADGTVTVHNAHADRVEIMDGTWKRSTDGWEIYLVSRAYAGDPRMVDSERRLHLTSDRLSYRMHMRTTEVREMTLHLTAALTRLLDG